MGVGECEGRGVDENRGSVLCGETTGEIRGREKYEQRDRREVRSIKGAVGGK